jgi:hypothetical protein
MLAVAVLVARAVGIVETVVVAPVIVWVEV